MSNKDINFRTRNFFFLFYPKEDDSHAKALDFIKQYYDYIAINHDRDIDFNGELKKEHTHVIVKFNNPRYRNSVCKELGIEFNYCRPIKKLNDSLLYLIHYEDFSKFNYDLSDCFGNLVYLLESLIFSKEVNDEVIYKFVFSICDKYQGVYIKPNMIYQEFLNNGYGSLFSKYFRFIRDEIYYHNDYLKLSNK